MTPRRVSIPDPMRMLVVPESEPEIELLANLGDSEVAKRYMWRVMTKARKDLTAVDGNDIFRAQGVARFVEAFAAAMIQASTTREEQRRRDNA